MEQMKSGRVERWQLGFVRNIQQTENFRLSPSHLNYIHVRMLKGPHTCWLMLPAKQSKPAAPHSFQGSQDNLLLSLSFPNKE